MSTSRVSSSPGRRPGGASALLDPPNSGSEPAKRSSASSADRPGLGQRLQLDDAREDRVAGEVPGQERLVAGHPVAGHDALARHQLVDRVDEAERRPVGQAGPSRRSPARSTAVGARCSRGGSAVAGLVRGRSSARPGPRRGRRRRRGRSRRSWRGTSRTAGPRTPGHGLGVAHVPARAGPARPQASSIAAKPGIDRAASVRSGPAATRLTRTPSGAQVAGQVAGRRLERGLGHAHPVVGRPGLGGVEVEADDRPAVGHQRQPASAASDLSE